MSTSAATRVNFRKRDLTAALDCIRKSGVEIKRIEIEGGKLVIVTGKPEERSEAPPHPLDGAEF